MRGLWDSGPRARPANYPKQVVHALGGPGQQGHVGVGPIAADVVATAIPPLDASLVATRGPGRDIGLHADDRLDVVLARLGPELVGAVDIAVVGGRDGGHPLRRGGAEQFVDPGRPVEHGVLGVAVQMDEVRPPVGRRTAGRGGGI